MNQASLECSDQVIKKNNTREAKKKQWKVMKTLSQKIDYDRSEKSKHNKKEIQTRVSQVKSSEEKQSDEMEKIVSLKKRN